MMTKGLFVVCSLVLMVSPMTFADVGAFSYDGRSLHVNGDQIRPTETYPYYVQTQLALHIRTDQVLHHPLLELATDANIVSFDPYPTGLLAPSTYLWDYPSHAVTGIQSFHVEAIKGIDIVAPRFSLTRQVDSPLLETAMDTQTVSLTVQFEEPLPSNINMLNLSVRRTVAPDLFSHVVVLAQKAPAGWIYDAERVHWRNEHPHLIQAHKSYRFEVTLRYTKQPSYYNTAIYCKPFAQLWWGQWRSLPNKTDSAVFMTYPDGSTVFGQFDHVLDWEYGYGIDEDHIHLRETVTPIDSNRPTLESILVYRFQVTDHNCRVANGLLIQGQGKNLVQGTVTTPSGRVWPLEVDAQQVSLEFSEGPFSDAQFQDLGLLEGAYLLSVQDPQGRIVETNFTLPPIKPSQVPDVNMPVHRSTNQPRDLEITWAPIVDPNANQIILSIRDDWDLKDSQLFFLTPDTTSHPLSDLPPQMGHTSELFTADVQTDTTSENIPSTIVTAVGRRVHFVTGE